MGPWIFASVVVVVIAVLSVKYPTFRKWFFLSLLGVAALGGVAIYVVNWQESIERERRSSLIKPWEIYVSDLRLALPTNGNSSAALTGEVKNNSGFKLNSFDFRIQINKCDAAATNCKLIYTSSDSAYLPIPPNEVRNLNEILYLSDFPTLDKWTWDIVVTKVISE